MENKEVGNRGIDNPKILNKNREIREIRERKRTARERERERERSGERKEGERERKSC
jgi:hypothetical protein